ncbi:MAG: hypothetical protein WCI89_02370 [bacterium]
MIKTPSSFIAHATDVASFYGFRPLRDVEKELQQATRAHTIATLGRKALTPAPPRTPHSFGASIDTCVKRFKQRDTEPVLAFYTSASPTHTPRTVTTNTVGEFGLQVVGSSESLGEILLLKTLFAIMSEWGAGVSRVRVNALGDHDSKVRFERELAFYLRKHSAALDPTCRKTTSENMLGVYTCQNEHCRQVLADGPRAMNFLSEKSRAHFREVLEYIESLGLPYEIDDLLVGDERNPHVVFALDLLDTDTTVLGSAGGRYDEYVRKAHNHKEGSAVSASIFFHKKGTARSDFASSSTQQKSTLPPKVYFVQLGNRAKLQGLAVIDILRQAHVPVMQSFDAKGLAPQLESAKARGASHLLIMGQREALDGTIIVRSAATSAQMIVGLDALPRFLKTLKV